MKRLFILAGATLALFAGAASTPSVSPADECDFAPAVPLVQIENAGACGNISGWHYVYSSGDDVVPWPHTDRWFYDPSSGYYEYQHNV